MMKPVFFQRLVYLLLLIFPGSLYAAASLDSLTVTNAPTSITIGQSTVVNLSWTITVSSDNNVTGNIVATSTGGAYANRLGTNTNRLSYNYGQTNGLVSAPHVFSEPLLVPASLTTTASNLGLTSLQYSRTFNLVEGTIPSGTLNAVATINLVQPSSTGGGGTTTSVIPNTESVLDITRVALHFSDNSIVKLIRPETRISAVADINYTGTGLLDARWEVADPSSTRATPFYIPIRSVRQFLGAGGHIYLQSPTLPSRATGNYIVRLRVRAIQANPSPDTLPSPEQQVILRYSVNPNGGTGGTRLPPISLRTPSANALLTENTLFSWQPVKGARAYQLELYARPANGTQLDEADLHRKMPASGILVPGRKTGIGLGALSRSHLQHGQTYYWRIMAIGPQGEILTTSLLREIRIP